MNMMKGVKGCYRSITLKIVTKGGRYEGDKVCGSDKRACKLSHGCGLCTRAGFGTDEASNVSRRCDRYDVHDGGSPRQVYQREFENNGHHAQYLGRRGREHPEGRRRPRAIGHEDARNHVSGMARGEAF